MEKVGVVKVVVRTVVATAQNFHLTRGRKKKKPSCPFIWYENYKL